MRQSTISELSAIFGFTEEELALNRAGQLSERQIQQVRYQSIGYLMRGFATVLLTLILTGTLAARSHRPVEIALVAFIGLLLVVLSGTILFAAYQVSFPTVRSITGPVRLGSSAWHPSIIIAGQEMRIAFRRWKRLPPALAGRYRAYYVHYANNLLSLEPIR